MSDPRAGQLSGVEDLTPDDGAERLSAALGGRVIPVRRRETPPPFPRTPNDDGLAPLRSRTAEVTAAMRGERNG